MNTRRTCFRTLLTMSALLLVGCSSSGSSPDNTLPIITLTGDNPQILALSEAYAELGAMASDNRSGDLTASIVIDASGVDTSTPGDYTVTYNVNDAAGNAATVTRTVTVRPPVPEQAEASVSGDTKRLIFNWDAVQYTDHYRLMENPDGHSGFTGLGEDIPADTLTATQEIAVHLFDWYEAQYVIEACNVTGCSTSDIVTATDVMLDTVGYFKASNTDWGDYFGVSIALSADGTTLAVGANAEKSLATGINGDQDDNSGYQNGAVYLFRRADDNWVQQAYIKASNTIATDLPFSEFFGEAVALSADGNTLAVGAHREKGVSTGVNGDQAIDLSSSNPGAVYLYRFVENEWSQEAYIKASNHTGRFGWAVSLSADGNTLAVSSEIENSSATGINGDQDDEQTPGAGAVYVFRHNAGNWSQQAYVKASNTGENDHFGWSIELSADGNTLAVGARDENSSATGINGDQTDNSCCEDNEGTITSGPGAVYVFRFEENAWYQQAYIKASDTTPGLGDLGDGFGSAVSVSADGNTLAVGAPLEDSYAIDSGAVYLFRFENEGWYQQAIIKASNVAGVDGGDNFGHAVSISAGGNILAVGTPYEDSNATGINGDDTDNSTSVSGAAYVFRFNSASWSQYAYIKAPRTEPDQLYGDAFARAVALSADGKNLAVGATSESSSATGINGDQDDNSAPDSGAVYLY